MNYYILVTFYGAVLTPVLITLIFNMVVVGVVVRSIFAPNIATQKKKTTQEQCRITILISMLLGGNWLLALFGVGSASLLI